MTIYGYSDYKALKKYNTSETSTINKISKDIGNVNGKTLLDIGGAIGAFAQYAKEQGCLQYDVLDLNIDGWCLENVREDVDKFITGNALDILPTIPDNSYDLVFTSQFLDCLSDDDIVTILREIDRITIDGSTHIVTPDCSKDWYNPHELSWYATRGYSNMTFVNYGTKDKVTV